MKLDSLQVCELLPMQQQPLDRVHEYECPQTCMFPDLSGFLLTMGLTSKEWLAKWDWDLVEKRAQRRLTKVIQQGVTVIMSVKLRETL